MKQLTVFEMEAISGGYTWDFSSASAAITSLASNAVEAVGAMALGGIVTAVIELGLVVLRQEQMVAFWVLV